MRKLLQKLFTSNPKPKDDLIDKINHLDLLASSIADIGCWTWWAEDLPSVFQLEFNGTQLFIRERETKPPSTQLAIQFLTPRTISFVTRIKTDPEASIKWFELLHKDELPTPTCSHESFTFTHTPTMKKMLEEVVETHTVHGYEPSFDKLVQEAVTLTFWAGNYGMVIGADNMQLWSKDGAIPLKEIPNLRARWWTYWKEYWDRKDSEHPLPYDVHCEVTIPAEG